MFEDNGYRALKIFLLTTRDHPTVCPGLSNEPLRLRGTPLKVMFVFIIGVEVKPIKIAEAAVDEASHISTKLDGGTGISTLCVLHDSHDPRCHYDHSRHNNHGSRAQPFLRHDHHPLVLKWHLTK